LERFYDAIRTESGLPEQTTRLLALLITD